MSRRTRILLFCVSLPAFSQQRAGPGHSITLDVVVTAKNGVPVPGLGQQDFTLLDNKQPQKIVSFQAATPAEPPVEVILLIDRVNITFVRAAGARGQIDKFLRQNGGQLPYPVSMVFFSDSGVKSDNPSRDGNALADVFDKTDNGLRTVTRSEGIYGAEDRFRMSINALTSLAAFEEKKPGRKMLIWISPGWPMLSGPRIDLSYKAQEGLFTAIVGASAALRQARISLYSLDPLGLADAGSLGITWYKDFVKGVPSAKKVQAGNLALQVFAYQTGGLVLNSSNDIASQIELCLRDLSAYYVITFDSPPADGPNEYHALEVKVAKPGLTARTRTGYYAQP